MEVIFSHGDADGICSAALLYSKYTTAKLWITTPVGLLKDLRSCDAERVFICDIAISERDKDPLFEEFKRISDDGELVYVDHHPLPLHTLTSDIPSSKIVWDTWKSASELVFRFSGEEGWSHLALFGAIADYRDSTEFVIRKLDYYDKRTISLEAGLLSQCLGASRGDYAFKKEVIKDLGDGKMPSNMHRVVDRAISATKKEWRLYEYVSENVKRMDGIAVVSAPNGLSPTKAAKFAIGAAESPVGICAQHKNDHVDISVRKRSDLSLNLDYALRTIAPRLGGSGGGHESAAGARVPADRLEDLIKMLSKEVYAAL
ncbi:MAG: DHHA1 domain-containing protein [Candidatus Hydrothermarchaeaceae archaeon]